MRSLAEQVFKIRPRRTPPQPLLLACVLLMLIMLVMNVEVLTLAPQYATFGSQQYIVRKRLCFCVSVGVSAHLLSVCLSVWSVAQHDHADAVYSGCRCVCRSVLDFVFCPPLHVGA